MKKNIKASKPKIRK